MRLLDCRSSRGLNSSSTSSRDAFPPSGRRRQPPRQPSAVGKNRARDDHQPRHHSRRGPDKIAHHRAVKVGRPRKARLQQREARSFLAGDRGALPDEFLKETETSFTVEGGDGRPAMHAAGIYGQVTGMRATPCWSMTLSRILRFVTRRVNWTRFRPTTRQWPRRA